MGLMNMLSGLRNRYIQIMRLKRRKNLLPRQGQGVIASPKLISQGQGVIARGDRQIITRILEIMAIRGITRHLQGVMAAVAVLVEDEVSIYTTCGFFNLLLESFANLLT